METIRGKRSVVIDRQRLDALRSGFSDILIDLGTGDGRYVRHVARTRPSCFAIGVDAARENLRAASRDAPVNALYVIANALALPPGFANLATQVTINFPWGSLLAALLDGDTTLGAGLRAIARPGTTVDVRLNTGALTEAGWEPEAGVVAVQRSLTTHGFVTHSVVRNGPDDLRAFPTTWAKRLAYGREPRAWVIGATYAPPIPSGSGTVYSRRRKERGP